MESSVSLSKNNTVYARQIAFAAAFLLPMTKFLEAPSILASKAEGDILLPAILHFIIQASLLALLLFAASKSEKTLFERLNLWLGKGAIVFYSLYALYFIFAAVLPIFDLEKFTYAAFFDTVPTMFSFAFFFIFSTFVCVKGIKALGRAADLSLFLFLFPFLALIAMSLGETEFSHLLPLFGTKFGHTMSAFKLTTPHFSDVALLLPLLGNYKPKKGDSTKIIAGYCFGVLFSLIFFAVFFGVYSSIAPREHYAFSKIAQYFPALSVIGRIDLIFVYLLTIVLFIISSAPLLYSTEFISIVIGEKKKFFIAVILNIALLIFVFFCNKYYDSIYTLFSNRFAFIFWIIADILPLFLLFLPAYNKNSTSKKKESSHV